MAQVSAAEQPNPLGQHGSLELQWFLPSSTILKPLAENGQQIEILSISQPRLQLGNPVIKFCRVEGRLKSVSSFTGPPFSARSFVLLAGIGVLPQAGGAGSEARGPTPDGHSVTQLGPALAC